MDIMTVSNLSGFLYSASNFGQVSNIV